MQQVSVLETNIGSSTTGNSANTQVIFNDAGTLRGDAGLTYNKATDTLTTGSATITGDLTVDTSTLKVDSANDRVGIGTTTPYALAHANGTIASANFDWTSTFTAPAVGLLAASNSSSASIRIATLDSNPTHDPFVNFLTSGGQNWSIGIDNSDSDKFKIALTNGFTGSSEIFAADPSGVFSWYDGAGGTRMTLNSTGLGIGTSPDRKLHVGSAVYPQLRLVYTGVNTYDIGVTSGGVLALNHTSTTNGLVLDSSGNVGVGVTPSAWSSSYKVLDIAGGGGITSLSNGLYLASNGYENGGWKKKGAGYANLLLNVSGEYRFNTSTAGGGVAGDAITFTQAMTLDASGNLLVGTTSALISPSRRLSVVGTVAATLQSTGAATVEAVNVWHTATTGDNKFIEFDTEASVTARGSISYNRAGGLVAYNTTSDYRAKDIIGPVSNSGSVIDSLKVYIGKMKGASVERPMLVAHEAQTVAPYAVTGEKDAVDVDGNPRYQQMDVSSFVPLLIAEIQSLRARVQTLEAR
jgi:hypothetical protein